MSEFNTKRLLQYQEYKDCFKVKICNKDGEVFKQNFLGGVTLRSTTPVRIGIDQSSSQTGVAVKKSNGEFMCLIDFVNSSCLNYNLYKTMLGLKIEQVFSNVDVEICVVEKMWGGNKKSFEMLSELASFIEGFKYIIPSWSKAEISEILPNVWRSDYLAGPEYKGMFTKDKVKFAALLEGIKRYPQLSNYGNFHREGDHINDSFDALGILEGYEGKTFSKDKSMRKVANTIAATNHAYSYAAAVCDDFNTASAVAVDLCPGRSTVEYEYNTDYSFYENVRRATSVTNKIVCMRIVEDIVKIQLMWRYGRVFPRDKDLYLIGWRDRVSSRLDNY